jgi:nucleotide-binding universal stress UspA family protein
MNLPKSLLVPTDFSETAAAALDYAKALAKALGAGLHVLHVVEDPLVLVPAPPAAEGYPALLDLREDLTTQARRTLETLLTEPERETLRAKVDVVSGVPHVEIVAYAEREKLDLIVMGTHGRGPVTRLLLGSVADRVIRRAPCPVLIVRPPAGPETA